MRTSHSHIKLLIFSFLTCFLIPALAMAIQITPEQVEIGATFNGQNILISGEIDQNEEAVIQVIGNSTEAHFKQTGKVGGLLWMTVAHFSLSGAPTAYFVYLPKTISSWRQNGDNRWSRLNLDYSTLQKDIIIKPEQENKDIVFNDFLKLKTAYDLYQMVDDGVIYKKDANGRKTFIARIHIPAGIPLDTYTIRVLTLKDGIIAETESADLHVTLKGFPLFISNMAYNRSLLYGVLAVLIAIGAGFFMGMVFKDKGGSH